MYNLRVVEKQVLEIKRMGAKCQNYPECSYCLPWSIQGK